MGCMYLACYSSFGLILLLDHGDVRSVGCDTREDDAKTAEADAHGGGDEEDIVVGFEGGLLHIS